MAEIVLEKNRIQLIDGLSEPVIKHLLDDLRGENVVNSGESEEIVQKTKTRTDQARDLIDCVKRKGRKASEILLKCLEKRDECVYKNLNMDGHSKIPETAVTSSHIPITSDESSNTDEEYKMDSNPRGLCIIINNENFKNPKKKRNGSQKDVDSLKDLFEDLGFRVEIEEDQTASEIKELMINYSKDRHHGDCFVCCVMSHGRKTGVLGCDEEICLLSDITSPFDGDNCRSLIGKPKVFFIQACRGPEMQSTVLTADGPGASRMQDSGSVSYSIAKDSDFLIAMSTVEGYMSIRNKNSGSWFIQSLCKHLREGSKRGQDILGILTKVNNEVSQKEGTVIINNDEIDAKMTPQPLFTLRKLLVFRAPKAAASK
ncbi:caspase-22 isoform X2 [Ctenopharyngodon idella]|uniref:caspase-22 isoform X2 n=1 Tax=Ctenopharyngodon idella TaxID=7959 RepID=UPI00222EF7B5|nr:caspase-22 isoform X2 [Ctenopharyngodon idella]